MARHFNVTIDTIHPYGRSIVWPDLIATEKRNVARRDHATKALWRACYEALDGLALRDRPIAYLARNWALTIAATMDSNASQYPMRRNWRECYEIGNFIIVLERSEG